MLMALGSQLAALTRFAGTDRECAGISGRSSWSTLDKIVPAEEKT